MPYTGKKWGDIRSDAEKVPCSRLRPARLTVLHQQERDAHNAPAGGKVADHRLLQTAQTTAPKSTGVKKAHWGDTRSEAEKVSTPNPTAASATNPT